MDGPGLSVLLLDDSVFGCCFFIFLLLPKFCLGKLGDGGKMIFMFTGRAKTKKSFLVSLFRWLIPFFWMALIFYGSSRHRVKVADQFWLNFLFFKTLHVLEYGILFLLWHLPLNKPYRSRLAGLISVLYGASDEIHQTFVPTRHGAVRDVFIDALGVVMFALIFRPLLFLLKDRHRQPS